MRILLPRVLHENALVRNSNWGPPMSYAANLGRDQIIDPLIELAADARSAIAVRTSKGLERG